MMMRMIKEIKMRKFFLVLPRETKNTPKMRRKMRKKKIKMNLIRINRRHSECRDISLMIQVHTISLALIMFQGMQSIVRVEIGKISNY